MKTKIRLGMIVIAILPLLLGCGEKEVLTPEPSLSMSETFKYESNDEAGEGYVYDYQVSMEPIPVEIAALGGEVCGTIHAYPSEIEVGLAKKAIEENPEWQKMNEENIEFLKTYLTDKYGGEFEVEPMTTDFSTDEYMMNRYRCTEALTGNKFSITLYKNPYLELNEGKIGRNDYLYEKDAEKYKSDIEQALNNSWNNDRCYNVFYECIEGIDRLDVYVALFRNDMIEYMEEQERIVSFYEQLKKVQKESKENFTLRIVITYFPLNYSNVIKKQYESNEIMNYNHIITTRADRLIANGEVYAQFEYDEDVSFDEEQCLDEVVADKEGYFANPYKLQYWR